MALFRGTFDHTLDAKNRLTVPARYRDEFAGGAVLALPFDKRPCVGLWCPAVYDGLTSSAVEKLPALSSDRSLLERFLYSSSHDAELDKAGRVMIPTFLARHASLAKDVMVVGVGNRLELWDHEVWEQNRPQLYEGITEVIARAGGTA